MLSWNVIGGIWDVLFNVCFMKWFNWKFCIDLLLSEWFGVDWIFGFVDCFVLNVCVVKKYFMLELLIKMNW